MGEQAVLIMAGGRGERFWPLSRTSLPKQFLRLWGPASLLQETFRRATTLVPPEAVFVVTPAAYADLTLRQLPELAPGNLVVEPVGRDTAPCIGLGGAAIQARLGDAVFLVVPADHAIGDEATFRQAAGAALVVAGSGPYTATLGMRPTRPETGYGYIHPGAPAGEAAGQAVFEVRAFVEKPGPEVARALVEAGCLWNSGLFAWRASVLRGLMEEHLPWLAGGLARLDAVRGTPREEDVLAREYAAFRPVSIDFGLLERASGVRVIPAAFGWDDVGSWSALERLKGQDGDGNTALGEVEAVECRDSILFNNDAADRLLVAFGVHGLLVVDAGDVVLVADKERASQLKGLVEALRTRGRSRYVEGGGLPLAPLPPLARRARRVVEKPWGREIWWAVTDRYVGKLIEVRAGCALSLQLHRRKLETLFFVRGKGTLLLGEEPMPLEEGLCVDIPPGTVHRVLAETDVAFYEVSTPDLEDVVRLADDYGRASVLPDVPAPPRASAEASASASADAAG